MKTPDDFAVKSFECDESERASIFAEAMAAARREALEEAAKKAECWGADDAADEIRDLVSK